MQTSLVAICHRCKYLKNGLCIADGRNIIINASERKCPKGLFPSRPPENIEGHDIEQERRRLKQGGCCGSPAKE